MKSFLTNGLTRSQQLLVGAILATDLLVHLSAGRIEEVLKSMYERHWISVFVEITFLILLVAAALWLGFRVYRGATSHRLVAPNLLPLRFGIGEFGTAVDTLHVVFLGQYHRACPAIRYGKIDDVDQVELTSGIITGHTTEKCE